jgi:hypothetical protein
LGLSSVRSVIMGTWYTKPKACGLQSTKSKTFLLHSAIWETFGFCSTKPSEDCWGCPMGNSSLILDFRYWMCWILSLQVPSL